MYPYQREEISGPIEACIEQDLENKKILAVETEKAIYEIEFGQIQIEITGRCNMCCQHCRGVYQEKKDMEVGQVVKIIQFARQFSPNYKEIVLSGGEPLMHDKFVHLLRCVRLNGGESVTLTTNGSLLTEKHLKLVRDLEFSRFTLSVSLDNLNPEKHDIFRRYKGAFDKAVATLKLVANSNIPNLIPSMRSTIQAYQIPEMERMVLFAQELGCKRISFSAIHPAGKAIERRDLWMTREQKKTFLEEIYRLKRKFPMFNITTNDPLKCLIRGNSDIGTKEELVFDGCVAAAVSFNVNADGTMTPCALLNLPMMNIFPLTIQQMTEQYQVNQIVKEMLDMNLKGKCGNCQMKYRCGGCRARALIEKEIYFNEDPQLLIKQGAYLEEDPHCWL